LTKLSLWQKIQLKINGYVFLRWEKHGQDYLQIYLVHCKKHGYYEDFPHGSWGFYCPKCDEEFFASKERLKAAFFYLTPHQILPRSFSAAHDGRIGQSAKGGQYYSY